MAETLHVKVEEILQIETLGILFIPKKSKKGGGASALSHIIFQEIKTKEPVDIEVIFRIKRK